MALSDCEKCWDTPCSCGYGYRNYTKEMREELAANVLGVDVVLLRNVIYAPDKHPKEDGTN